VIAEQENVILE